MPIYSVDVKFYIKARSPEEAEGTARAVMEATDESVIADFNVYDAEKREP